MPYLRAFGSYLPERVVDNGEIGALVGADPAWICAATGIRERRFAAPDDTVASLGLRAANACLEAADAPANSVGFVIAASGSAERRFPGPAASIAAGLGIQGVPAIDLPMASAGSLFGLSLAARMAADYTHVLVVGSEIMSRTVKLDAACRDTAILFGDGAGACLVTREPGSLEIAGSLLSSDGDFADALRLDLDAPLFMDGRTIILHAARKLPRTIAALLERHGVKPAQVDAFLLHQANLNLIARVAQTLSVPEARFFHNLDRYGNTSSASLLIAAAEWWSSRGGSLPGPVVFAAFCAGFHWGSLLAYPVG